MGTEENPTTSSILQEIQRHRKENEVSFTALNNRIVRLGREVACNSVKQGKGDNILSRSRPSNASLHTLPQVEEADE